MEDIETFKKSAILQKSLDVVKMRAQEMDATRKDKSYYNTVKSKVAKNIKVQKKTAKRNKKARELGQEYQDMETSPVDGVHITM